MESKWVKNGRRTPLAHSLVLAVRARLRAHGWTRDTRKAVKQVIGEVHKNVPAYRTETEPTLRWAFYRTDPLPNPPRKNAVERRQLRRAALRRRWFSLLMKWGKATKRRSAILSAEEAREIISRLRAVVPPDRRADMDQLFVHMEQNRIHWSGRRKIKWIEEDAIDELAVNPYYWPIPLRRRGKPNETAARIERYLANAPEKGAHKGDIGAALNIPKTTAQTTLCSMERAGLIERVANGVYRLPTKGGSTYLPAEQAILKRLAAGSCTNAKLEAATGHTEAAIHAAIHRLRKQGKITSTTRSKRGVRRGEPYTRYALARRANHKRTSHPA